jgi:hypothetical protein
VIIVLVVVGCSSQPGPVPEPAGDVSNPSPATDETPAAPEASPQAEASPQPEAAEPAPSTSLPVAETSPPPVVDVGGPVEVAATKPGLSRVGSDKCKLCHKVQFASWSESAHAKRTPPLDCESCHGAGSEYKGLAVMKDPEKARSAGLVIPDGSFCAKCHKAGWTDDLLKRAHAHKDESS